MQYYQEGCQGLLGWWRESQQPRLSLGEVGLLEEVVAVEPIDDLGIDFFYPSSPSPFPGKMAGVPARGHPLLLGVVRPEERDSGKWHGALGLPGAPAPGTEQGPPGTVPCFHFRCFSASCSERPVPKIILGSPLMPIS